jgi:hypothetical protein
MADQQRAGQRPLEIPDLQGGLAGAQELMQSRYRVISGR